MKYRLLCLMSKLFVVFYIITIPSWCLGVDDFDLEFYVNPTALVGPIERYYQKYDWDQDSARKKWLNDNCAARKSHSENLCSLRNELYDQVCQKIYRENENDLFEKKLIEASISSFLEKNLGKSTCNLKALTKYTRKNLYCLREIKKGIFANNFIPGNKSLEMARKYYKELDEEGLAYVLY